jgi:hypothetical protein
MARFPPMVGTAKLPVNPPPDYTDFLAAMQASHGGYFFRFLESNRTSEVSVFSIG